MILNLKRRPDIEPQAAPWFDFLLLLAEAI